MPRRAEIPVRELEPDPLYGSKLVSQVVNKVMLEGKKSTAEHIVYSAMEKVGERTGKAPVEPQGRSSVRCRLLHGLWSSAA